MHVIFDSMSNPIPNAGLSLSAGTRLTPGETASKAMNRRYLISPAASPSQRRPSIEASIELLQLFQQIFSAPNCVGTLEIVLSIDGFNR